MKRVMALLVAICGVCLSFTAQKMPPHDVLTSNGFPATDSLIKSAREDQSVLRAHGWDLFRMVWQNVSENGGFVPRWYTWCTDAEMYDSAPSTNCTDGQGRDLRNASRFSGLRSRVSSQSSIARHSPALPEIVSQTYFSPKLAEYLRSLPTITSVVVPLAARGDTFSEMSTSVLGTLLDRGVNRLPEAPPAAIAMKVAWVEVSCPNDSSIAPPSVPAWDGKIPESGHLVPATFPKLFIDPKTMKRKGCKPLSNAHIPGAFTAFPINDFFWFQSLAGDPITGLPDEVTQPRSGDYLMVTGFHIVTHEQANWVWATYWLSDSDDSAFVKDRPGDLQNRKGAHFAMNITLDDTAPVFNPFLEGETEGFEKSNCLRCHTAASVYRTAKNAPLTCEVPKEDDLHPTLRDDSLQTAFLWTIARRATSDCSPMH